MDENNHHQATVRQSTKAWIASSPTFSDLTKMLGFGFSVIALMFILFLTEIVSFTAVKWTSIAVIIAELAIFFLLFLASINGILARHGVYNLIGLPHLSYSFLSVTENRKREQKALHSIITGRGEVSEDLFSPEPIVLTEVKKAENAEVIVELIGRDGKDIMFTTNHYPTPVAFTKISNKYSALKSDTQKPNAGEKAIESFANFEPYYLKAVALKAELEEKERAETVDKKKPVRMLFRSYSFHSPIEVRGMYDDCSKYINDYLLHEQNPELPKPNSKKVKVSSWGWAGNLEEKRTKQGSIYHIENTK